LPTFDTVLIANRGEIVARIARSARALGYRTIGVYSEADAGAAYLDGVDEAVAIGPAAPTESYLSIERLIGAARLTGAGAVHPGYGFLSENALFAQACAGAGLVWVGPPPSVLRLMGEKAAAKAAVAAAGVRCVPGVESRGSTDAELAHAAAGLSLPLLVKAAAGGGGRGMRRVDRREDLAAALAEGRREAEAAFGSGDLLIEQALDGARHVEVQVLFDAHGHGVHLGERDCSAQRRHQKIVEESPCPALDAAAREALCRSAVEAAAAAGYVGAGTLEFLVANGGQHYFLEMNARLQVEHAVTEMVTGFDLVEMQLRVAAGEPLDLPQSAVRTLGHAIEARLYAEDPEQGFVPQSGTLAAWKAAAGPGVRVDHALRAGMTIPPDYDPLLAKIVARGQTREEARRRLVRAIEATRALGLVTNKGFLLRLLESETFVAGETTTDFVERWMRDDGMSSEARGRVLPALAGLVLSGAAERAAGPRQARGRELPWSITLDDGAAAIELRSDALGVEVLSAARGEVVYLEDGVRRTAEYARVGDAVWIDSGRAVGCYRVRGGASRTKASPTDEGTLHAPMAAQVVAVEVAAGDRVEKGAVLVVLRAMKLEHRVIAPRAASVREVLAREGDQVAFRQPLVRLESVAAEPAAAGAPVGS
jgi:geranyl-CoA carboxylase alpha subunit